MDYSYYGSWYDLEKIIVSHDPLFESTLQSSQKHCYICYENTQSLLNSHQCSRGICDPCLLRFLHVVINGQVTRRNQRFGVSCYCGYCGFAIPEPTILRLIANDQNLMKKYLRYKNNLLVKFDQSVCWCPRPNCETILNKPSHGKQTTCSTCHFQFCHICRQEVLSPEHEMTPCSAVSPSLSLSLSLSLSVSLCLSLSLCLSVSLSLSLCLSLSLS
jgi:hypothetical protein